MTPLIIYFSGRFLTKHPVNKNLISLKPKIIGSYIGAVYCTADGRQFRIPLFPIYKRVRMH